MRKVLFFLFLFLNYYIVFSDLYISSVMPNTLDDANLEYIEIYNSGAKTESLSSYFLEDLSGKSFYFADLDQIRPYERKKYYRQYTGIILNNTDEEIKLYDENNILVDKLYYKSSTKGLSINKDFGDATIFNNYSNLYENKTEGKLIGDILEISGTGIVDIINIPDIKIEIQSGLDYSGSGSLYYCKKEDCSVNLTVENLFTGSLDISNYNCIWSFSGSTSYSTGTDLKCNPGYIYYTTGEFEINLKIEEKGKSENYKTGSIIIQNGSQYKIVEIPDIRYNFQLPTYLSNNEELLPYYYCDSSREECKVNFDLSPTFENYTSADYECLLDFGFNTSEDNKCNPNTIIFPNGENLVTFMVYQKGKQENNKIISFKIVNNGYNSTYIGSSGGGGIINESINIAVPEIIVQSGLDENYNCRKEDCTVNLIYEENQGEACKWDFSGGNYSDGTELKCNPGYVKYPIGEYDINLKVYQKGNESNYKERTIKIKNTLNGLDYSLGNTLQAKITLQGKIGQDKELNGNVLKCYNTSECSVNFDGRESIGNSLKYVWDFGDGEVLEDDNPGYKKFSPGKYEVRLKIIDKNGNEDTDIFYLEVYEGESSLIEENLGLKAKITVQGKIGQDKELNGNILKCYNTSECSVNFDGRESIGSSLKYIWDFGNGEVLEDDNPGYKKFSPGEYKIILKITDKSEKSDIDTFIVKVFETSFDPSLVVIGDYNLVISGVLPNPRGVDTDERIEIKNIGDTVVNMKLCELDDILDGGSRRYKIEDDLFLSPGSSKKFYKNFTGINLNNDGDEVNLFCYGSLVDSLSRDFSPREGLKLTHEYLEIDTQEVQIIEIIDGDTFRVRLGNGEIETLRLIGVDTPETKDPRKEIQFFGEEAYKFSLGYLLGKTMTLEIEARNYRDDYGRLLGYLRMDSGDLYNEFIIKNGYARVYLRYPFLYSEDFEKAQNYAQKNNLGIWSDSELLKELKKEIKIEKNELEEDLIIDEINEIEQQALVKLFGSGSLDDFINNEKIRNYIDSSILKDLDGNGIPDDFEIEKNNSFSGELSQSIIDMRSLENYNNFIKETFSLNISYQKKGIKFSGKTIPFARVEIITSNGDIYTIYSDRDGIYSLLITDVYFGEYELKIRITDIYKNNFDLNNDKKLIVEKDYILALQDYLRAEYEKELKKANKKKKITKKKTVKKKNTVPKIKNFFINVVNASQGEESISLSKGIPFEREYIFLVLIILGIFFSYFLLDNKKIV